MPLLMHQSYILKKALVKNMPQIASLVRANATQSAQKSTGEMRFVKGNFCNRVR